MEENKDYIPISRGLVNKAKGFWGHQLRQNYFAQLFEETYGIKLTDDQVAFIMAQIERGFIPRATVFGMAVVLLEEKF